MINSGNEDPYPFEEYTITEYGFSPENLLKNESVFTLANGYIGFRGNLEAGLPASVTGMDGTYLNGVFETEPIVYGEIAYGYAKNSQTICNCVNPKEFAITADGERLDLLGSSISEFRRQLNMKDGTLRSSLLWETVSGCLLRVSFTRMVSLSRKHIAAVSATITALRGAAEIQCASPVQAPRAACGDPEDPRTAAGKKTHLLPVSEKWYSPDTLIVTEHTQNSHQAVVCAIRYSPEGERARMAVRSGRMAAGCTLIAGQTAGLNGFIAFVSGEESSLEDWESECLAELREASALGFETLLREQREYLDRFWAASDIEIEGDFALRQGLRFNMFHLLQSAGKDGVTNIAAKGLTGQGYEGHYFWDTETYIIPFFLFTSPGIARNLLLSRFSMLDKARSRAREMSQKGALFPWRTIGGEECSAYYPAGTAQAHINADIAFAVKRYVIATKDDNFLRQYGAEILLETARFWADFGFFNPAKGGAFCLNCVTGPDEYNAMVDNNVYTNLLARENMLYAAQTLRWLKACFPWDYARLAEKTGLRENEPDAWEKAASRMYVPHDGKTGVYPQDDGFLDRPPWPLAEIPKENFPLLLHYHPLVIYRRMICKQADLILAMVMLGDRFSEEEKRVNFDFYDRVTTHDSSLSTAVFSILASELNLMDKAYGFFLSTARMDLDDTHNNTKDGLHMANMAGSWMALTQGFGGMRCTEEGLGFAPSVPPFWEGYSFRVSFCDRIIQIRVKKPEATLCLLAGEPLEITVYHNKYRLTAEKTRVPLR